MRFVGIKAAGLALLACGALASAQSPGSVESELKYAQEYMDAQKWDYAMWRYEGILLKDPDNAAAQAGYAQAKSALEAKKARQAEAARAFAGNAPAPAAKPAERRASVSRAKPASSARAMCDAQFGTCNAIYKSVATCAPRRAMCYTQNGVK